MLETTVRALGASSGGSSWGLAVEYSHHASGMGVLR